MITLILFNAGAIFILIKNYSDGCWTWAVKGLEKVIESENVF